MKNLLGMLVGGLVSIGMESLPAQTIPFTFTGTSPVSFGMDAAGTLSAVGTYGTGILSLSGAGTRMFWYPGKAAFRAGTVSGTQWDDANVSQYSFAFGQDTIASTPYTFAFGQQTIATGWNSFAAIFYANAIGDGSIAMGQYVTATGNGSIAFGDNNTSSGACAMVLGLDNIILGDFSLMLGYYNSTSVSNALVIGQMNVGGGTPGSGWVGSDPIFEIGNGQWPSGASQPIRSDALVVHNDGTAAFQGAITAPIFVTTAPAGDIPMFTGN